MLKLHAALLVAAVALLAVASCCAAAATAGAPSLYDRILGKVSRRLSLLASKAQRHIVTAPTGNITELANGFVWAENVWADRSNALFVSDDLDHKLYKIVRDLPTGPATEKILWLDGEKVGFTNILGLHCVPHTNCAFMYAIAQMTKPTSTHAVLRFSTTTANSAVVAAATVVLGNGIAVSNQTGTLWGPNEGGFIPNKGVVMATARLGTASANSSLVAEGLQAADGAWLDEYASGGPKLYVSEVLEGHILVFRPDLRTGALSQIAKYPAPGCKMVDDFCVIPRDAGASDVADFYAADWWNNSIVSWAVNRTTGLPISAPRVLASGLRSPTSVRPGCRASNCGVGFSNPRSLFVTEGGDKVIGLLSHTARLLELHL